MSTVWTKWIAIGLCIAMVFCWAAGLAENEELLKPNQMVSYTKDSPWIKAITKECEGLTNQREIYDRVICYYRDNFQYDFVKWASVGSGTSPDLEDCWTRKAGVDLDLGSMVCSMLRSQGIPAQLMVQLVDGIEAPVWVVAYIDDEIVVFNPATAVKAAEVMDMTLDDLTASDHALF